MKMYARMRYLRTEGFTVISTYIMGPKSAKIGVLTYSDQNDFDGARSEKFENVSTLEYAKVLGLWSEINSKQKETL